MREYLTFRLYGPMASWGDIAVGETRPSHAQPSKSAILGLLAAALGVDRQEEDIHRRLQQSYGFAVLVERPGTPLRDYHTTQTPTQASLKRQGGANTRGQELQADDLGTILSSRDYRCEALYGIFLWTEGPDAPFSLQEMSLALENPRFHLYLGRKSCPPALPLRPQIIQVDNLAQAVEQADFDDCDLLASLPRKGPKGFYWEGDRNEGFEPRYSFQRRDALFSRRRWQFLARDEHYLPLDEQA
ncbi:MAG: type I-E CRISPR-associated protein Cas5/CasD [Proteobacteria bacterium]|nr:type I-E CRISPR-associated protein Cas5/CasD [Pseudomonadota bacterium]MBU1450513.1 type I-E CRISPR-associated protein Cas5/CasD [Pseudomonadota bacterium]